MSLRSKIRVGVVRGGKSGKHHHSIKTGSHVLKNLPEQYTPVDIFVDQDGVWHLQGVATTLEKVLGKIDVFFNAIHGESTEGFKLQQLLDKFNAPYTGSGYFPVLFTNHKGHEKNFLKQKGIRTPFHKIFSKDWVEKTNMRDIWATVTNPSLIRPLGIHTVSDVSVVRSFPELEPALLKSFSISPEIIVEEYIKGREAVCGVIEKYRGEDVYSLLPTELIFTDSGQFSYGEDVGVEKYKAQNPGRFSELEKFQMQDIAKKVHGALGLRHYSQSHFVVSPNRGVYLTAVEALPVLTPNAPFTKSLDSVGLPFGHFLDQVIKLALNAR